MITTYKQNNPNKGELTRKTRNWGTKEIFGKKKIIFLIPASLYRSIQEHINQHVSEKIIQKGYAKETCQAFHIKKNNQLKLVVDYR